MNYKLTLVLILLSISITLNAQKLDPNFGIDGTLNLPSEYNDTKGAHEILEIGDKIFINNQTIISCLNMDGSMNLSFGDQGFLNNPFNSLEFYLINTMYFKNARLNLMGCFRNNPNDETDVIFKQFNPNTGLSITPNNGSIIVKENEDECFKHFHLNDDQTFFYGYERNFSLTSSFDVPFSGLLIIVNNQTGEFINLPNLSEKYVIFEKDELQQFIITHIHQLPNGNNLMFFILRRPPNPNIGTPPYKLICTYESHSEQKIVLEDVIKNMDSIAYKNIVIRESHQIDEENILLINCQSLSNYTYSSTMIYNTNSKDITKFDLVRPDTLFRIGALNYSLDGKYYVSGSKMDGDTLKGLFVYALDKNLNIIPSFGTDGVYYMEYGEDIIEPKKGLSNAFLINNNLYLYAGANQFQHKLIRIKLDESEDHLSISPNNEEAKIFPSPAHSFLTIKSTKSLENYIFKAYTVDGKVVLIKNLEWRNNEIDISTLRSGVYLYSIFDQNNDLFSSGKFVVER